MGQFVFALAVIAGVGILRANSGTPAQGALLCTSFILIQGVFYLLHKNIICTKLLTVFTIVNFLNFVIIIQNIIYIKSKISETDEMTGFRWSKPWPESPIALEYQVYWPETRRAWPAEVRIASYRCPPGFSILVDIRISDTLINMGTISLENDNKWHIPVKENFFDNNILTVKMHPTIYGTDCSVIYSIWKKAASVPDGNVRRVYAGHSGVSVNGSLIAQLWDPKY